MSSKEEERLDRAITGTDRQWWNASGNCGGCGMDACHPGVGCTPGWDGCRYCPDRNGDLTPPVKVETVPDTTPPLWDEQS